MRKMEAGGEMKRMTEIQLIEPDDAAVVIRTVFGQRGWQTRARGAFTANTIVAALWVAKRECGSERMRDILKWARQMRGKTQ